MLLWSCWIISRHCITVKCLVLCAGDGNRFVNCTFATGSHECHCRDQTQCKIQEAMNYNLFTHTVFMYTSFNVFRNNTGPKLRFKKCICGIPLFKYLKYWSRTSETAIWLLCVSMLGLRWNNLKVIPLHNSPLLCLK